MKFTEGFWRMREDLTASFAAEAREIEPLKDGMVAFAPARPIRHRGDTLNTAGLTVTVRAPAEGVIAVRITHHAGAVERGPSFAVQTDAGFVPRIVDDPEAVEVHSGDLVARIRRGEPWSLSFEAADQAGARGGRRLLTSSGSRNAAHIRMDDGRTFVREELRLGVGECVYGLGERFTAFVKNGQAVETWNEDGGTASQFAYKSIPFYLTNRGYGVLVNHPGHVSFEVASEKVERVQFSVPGEELEYYIIYGPAPKQVLARYTLLTGRPALPPAWTFGLWLTTSFTTEYDEQTVMGFVDGMAERRIPLHVFHYDCFWMREFHWCDFVWDPAVFPDPPGMLRRLHEKGLKACVWINPYIAQRSYLFEEGRTNGYLVTRPNGDVWQWDEWQSGMALVDFTNPAAYRWYQSKLAGLVEMGVDAFKTDFGERIPTDVVYHSGADPDGMHNYYSLLYNRAVFEVLEEKRGRGEACVFARSATVGGQQFPVHWGGDSTASYESMAETLRAGLSAGMSGIAFWSHDIGGFEDTAAPDLYKRWCAFGLLSSHSRLHGSRSYRVPWVFDDESVDVLRFFTRLKCLLMPYLFASAVEARETGVPLMRSMVTEFPTDPGCDYLDRQYMLGGDLLVAPVFSAEGDVSFYLPQGRWTHVLDGHVLEGGRWHSERYDFMSLPLFARPSSVIAWGGNAERPDYEYTHDLRLVAYELTEGEERRVRVPDTNGAWVLEVAVRRVAGEIEARTLAGTEGSWLAHDGSRDSGFRILDLLDRER
ncbi:MAG: alpha-xylosidase [Spirochaetota bacterium]